MAIVNVTTENSFEEWRQATNTIASNLGDLDNLGVGIPTTSVVDAINYVKENSNVDSDLQAIAEITVAGILVKTGDGTATTRSVSGQTNKIVVTNGNGVSGNISLAIGSDVVTLTDAQTLTNKTIGTGSTWSGNTIPLDKGGTGATTRGPALNNLLPSQAGQALKVLMTTGSDAYWGDAEGSGGGTGQAINIIRDTAIATAGQTIFNLSNITAVPVETQLKIFINGVRQFPDAYSLVGTTVTFSSGLTSGDKVLFELDGLTELGYDAIDIPITDAGGYFAAANVEAALAELYTVKQAQHASLTSIAGLTTSADKMIYTTASNTYAVTTLTSTARNLLDDASASDMRITLGLVIGTNVQAYDAGLNSIAGLTTSADKMIYTTGADAYAVTTLSSFARSLLDDADAATARATLGITTTPWSVVSSNTTLSSNVGVFVNTSSGAVTLTLPASPSIGDKIAFVDVSGTFGTNALTIARNGKLIMGLAEDLTVNVSNTSFELIFSNDTYGWRIL